MAVDESSNIKPLVSVLFFFIAMLAFISNLVLILLARNIPDRKRDIRMMQALAVVDILLPSLSILSIIYMLASGESIGGLRYGCRIKGPIDFIGLFISMLLVSLVAQERFSVVFEGRPSRGFLIWLAIYLGVYCGLVILAAARDEFKLLANGIHCSTVARQSVLSTVVLAMLGTSLFLFMIITVVCYLRILMGVLPIESLSDRYSNLSERPGVITLTRRRLSKFPVVMRTLFISLTYFLLVVPACILLVFEAILSIEESRPISIAIDLCLVNISVANPCLVLFTHSIMYQELTDALNNFRPFSQKATLVEIEIESLNNSSDWWPQTL